MEDEQVIRQQMQDTRTSLTEKLETLENKVTETVKDATVAVSETVETVKDSVQETVSTVKDTVEETVCAVKGSVEQGVQKVKNWFDLSYHAERHPWTVMAGALCTGYCVERCLEDRPPETSQAAVPAAPERHHHGNGHRSQRRGAVREKSVLSQFEPEINQLKSLALGALLGVAREMVLQAVPKNMGQQIKDLFDSTTKKLGGEPLPGDEGEDRPAAFHAGTAESRIGKPMGPVR